MKFLKYFLAFIFLSVLLIRTFILKNMFTRGMNDVRKEWTLSEDDTMVILPLNSKDIII